jgi:hypothetical protein
MNDNFKYYGFYGRKGNTNLPNYRASRQKASSNPQVNYKEFGVYVHTENPKIIEHLDEEYSESGEYGKHYGNVENLTFMPIEELLDKEITKVQNLINISYSYYHVDEVDKQISWAKIHALGREYMHSGYNSDLSKTIIDLIADKANEIKDNDIFDENQKQNLQIQSERKCNKIHEINYLVKEPDPDYNEIILEDYIFKKGEKQLILGFGKKDAKDITNFDNNPYAYNDPWLSRSTGLGFFVWNIMINKATIKCILDNNKILFPMQIILSTNPNYLFYEQIDINNKNIKYIGYFIARINLDKIEKPRDVDPECERLYDYTFDKIPESKEQYFVIFVFKNEDVKYDLDKYILTDFRLQRVHWGNLTRSKRVLFIEIQQLMCSSLYDTNEPEETKKQAYFYFISEYETGQNEPVNEICKSQKEEVEEEGDDKIKNKDCYQAWLDKDTFKLLNKHRIKLKGSSYKVFVSTYNFNEVTTELEKMNINKTNIKFMEQDKDLERLLITEELDDSVKEYILLPCHFKWEVTGSKVKDNKYNTKKTFVLKHGNLELINDETLTRDNPNYFNSVQYYKKELCINSNCILERDYIIHTFKHIITYKNDLSIFPDNYSQIIKNLEDNQNVKILGMFEDMSSKRNEQSGGGDNYNKILKLLYKIKLYKVNFKNIILSNNSFYLQNINNFERYFGFNLQHILNNNKKYIDKYIDKSNYLKITRELSHIINHIIDGDILIISNNLNMLLTCDEYLKNKSNYITLILINISINNLKNIYSSLYKNLNKNIKVHYFGNILNNELIINIIKYFNNTKFNNIIIDIVDNNQDFYNILGLKLCKHLLINKGLFIQYNKLPNIKDNLSLIYFYIFKCFKYNIFDNYTFFLLKDNMYSLIYHKIFEYNLNKDEENIINNLLNQDISQKTNLFVNLPFNQLFNDFLYIKYLTINYNLHNFMEQIFKTTYKLIENKTIKH